MIDIHSGRVECDAETNGLYVALLIYLFKTIRNLSMSNVQSFNGAFQIECFFFDQIDVKHR